MSHTLLIADNDEDLTCTIAGELAADGYRTLTACAPTALALTLEHSRPDLVVLGDFEGPGASARLVRWVREAREPFTSAAPETPILVLSSDGGQLSLLRAFDAGADDFLAKPASYLELRARVRAVLARSVGHRTPPTTRVGGLELDTAARKARYAGADLALSRLEYRLLCTLAAQPTRVYTKAELLRDVWGIDATQLRTRTVDAHACRLRRKLAAAGCEHVVLSRRGVGYALTEAAA